MYTEQDKIDLEERNKELDELIEQSKLSKAPQDLIENEEQRLNAEKEMSKKGVEEAKKYINTIQLGFNKEKAGEKIDFLRDFPTTKDSIYLDGEQVWCRNYETVEKIADNEYKIYHIILLTDDDLKGKTNYNITLKKVILANKGQLKQGEELMHKNSLLINVPNNARRIDIEGEFSVDVSKEKILENSKIIKLEDKKSSYKNVTQEIEEININPIQTIIRTKTIISGVSSNKRYYYDDEIQNPLWMEFKITDANGKELTSQSFETKKILTKGDGTVEEWYPGDIKGGSVYKNGTFELTEYIIVENNTTNKLNISPFFQAQDRTEDGSLEDIRCDLNTIKIDLT